MSATSSASAFVVEFYRVHDALAIEQITTRCNDRTVPENVPSFLGSGAAEPAKFEL